MHMAMQEAEAAIDTNCVMGPNILYGLRLVKARRLERRSGAQ
jgi:hypothetical protein